MSSHQPGALDGQVWNFDPKPIQFQTRAPFRRHRPAASSPPAAAAPPVSYAAAAARGRPAAGERPVPAASAAPPAAAPPPPLPLTTTLATQSSLDRWPAVAAAAAAWRGPVSAAVYIPAPPESKGAEAAEEMVAGFFDEHVARHPAQPLTVSLLYAFHNAREGASRLPPGLPPPDDAPDYDRLYPINALRNVALSQVSTPLVLQADADLIPSEGLAEGLAGQEGANPQLAAAARAIVDAASSTAASLMLVLPVFEVQGGNSTALPRTVAALRASGARPFHCGAFPQAAPSVDYAAWWAASEAGDSSSGGGGGGGSGGDGGLLGAVWADYFEPVGVAATKQVPLWDERFRGYGLNKVQLGTHLHALGFRFGVAPGAFMVTAPHPRAPTWRGAPGSAGDEMQLARMRRVYERFKQRLAAPQRPS